MKLLTWIAAFVAAVAIVGSAAPVSAQSAMKMKGSMGTAKAHKVTTSRGADPNIKHDVMAANPASVTVAKSTVKGAAARGAGNLHFDNHTNLYILCYVDGDYAGTMGPSGDLYDYEEGVHTMYCVAHFDDGSALTWGPFLVDAPYHLLINP